MIDNVAAIFENRSIAATLYIIRHRNAAHANEFSSMYTTFVCECVNCHSWLRTQPWFRWRFKQFGGERYVSCCDFNQSLFKLFVQRVIEIIWPGLYFLDIYGI